jgi:catechol 2,3-dioxygenase-like lactoylglutathione lyase family enzyme
VKINFRRIDHVQLLIPKGSEEKARKFYGGLLGLEEIEKPDSLKSTGGVWYKFAGGELHLGAVLDHPYSSKKVFELGGEKIEGGLKVEPGFGLSKKEHPGFEIENLDEVKKFLGENGVWLKEEIPIPGRKRFSFYDPFGNRIELLEYDK